jgi:hypothetical protein
MFTKEKFEINKTDLPGIIVHLAADGRYAGLILIPDEIKKRLD